MGPILIRPIKNALKWKLLRVPKTLLGKKRKTELENNSEAIIDFTSTIKNLRKLKVAAAIAKHIKATHATPFIYILINKPGFKFDLFIVENGIRPITDISDEGLTALITQAKVEPNITVISENEIADCIWHRN